MKNKRILKVLIGICFVLLLVALPLVAACAKAGPATGKEIRIGVGVSQTGAFAPAGALRVYRGVMTAIDMINDRGGVNGEYIIKPVVVDYQSNPDIAVREVERLCTAERVPIIIGDFSSSIGLPCAPIAERNKTIFFITNAISDAILQDRHQNYVFRNNFYSSQSGMVGEEFLNNYYQQLGLSSPSEIKVAACNEDGPYGASTWQAHEKMLNQYGMQVVLHESYATDIKDMSSTILKFKESDQNVIIQIGYAPDIILFWKTARDLGLKTQFIMGAGSLYNDWATFSESCGESTPNYVTNVDNPPAQLVPRSSLTPEAAALNQEFLDRIFERYGDSNPSTHYTDGCFATWNIFSHVMPLALEKYGEITADTLRMAFLEVDVPPEQDPRGWGCKYYPPEHEMAGQNMRAMPSLLQWVDGELEIVWPEHLQTQEPIIPLPSDSIFAR